MLSIFSSFHDPLGLLLQFVLKGRKNIAKSLSGGIAMECNGTEMY